MLDTFAPPVEVDEPPEPPLDEVEETLPLDEPPVETVDDTLPLADAKVFYVNDESTVTAGNRRQLGVMLSWRENESDQSSQTSADQTAYLKYFHLTSKEADGTTVSCPSNRSCHLQFIQLASRCVANSDAGPGNTRYFCADGGVLKLPSAP